MNYFEELKQINVNDKTEKKNGLTYLSWSYAIEAMKARFPDFSYKVFRFENNLPYVFDENTGYMVFTSVTIEGNTTEMFLPVMDGANKAMKNKPYTYLVKDWKTKQMVEKTCEAATMFDINKTIMRCLAKNIAVASGYGLYLYAGEDLPTSNYVCENCKRDIQPAQGMTPEQIAAGTYKTYQKCLCMVCAGEAKKHRLAQQALLEQKEIPVEVIEG